MQFLYAICVEINENGLVFQALLQLAECFLARLQKLKRVLSFVKRVSDDAVIAQLATKHR